jgi:hypothetical protein
VKVLLTIEITAPWPAKIAPPWPFEAWLPVSVLLSMFRSPRA